MNTIDSSQLLTQLRAASLQAQGLNTPEIGVGAGNGIEQSPAAKGDFSSMLSRSIDMVNNMEKSSSNLASEFEMGNPNVTLPEVMIAKAKAGIAFEGMVQVRNKVVESYQEIMRMPV
ncbi:MAG: flagellar hook-basal body complex protein FliE [Gammaproteobacteria bacterium]|nr:flagellar hook-basal body complex protein FliE [Gammaproteobacteria bacterium]MCW8983044.1 flagellar hook-basal body complex protein FliE [Gammaproteobacteria bacterium]